ncbi:MAG: aminotransferase class V-fold PLP-dependent enzyme [Candidatus Kaistia colombiensis]|nr:MAG: aminotransferase class V-fold PLP-dependent enzyme [Kaistia sp.]
MSGDRNRTEADGPTPLQRFRASLDSADPVRDLRAGLIGEGRLIEGPFGPKPLVYADYVASGRALRQVETFVMDEVLPFYANSHTEASYCGAAMTRMRHEARATIGRLVGADAGCAVIFTGSGATAGINRLVSLFGVAEAARRGEAPLVLIGPYEHHSNILPWRESGAEVVEIAEAAEGGPDLAELEAALVRTGDRRLRIGAFSAASNVTGILTDTDAVTAILKRHGALAVWDYAGGGPYLAMRMAPAPGQEKDAIVLSPHKFAGGPGASGLLVVRKAAVARQKPSWPGGGTVTFVSPWRHDYVEDLAAREEAGTPNVIGDIRAALAFLVKDAIGQDFIDSRHRELNARALAVWERNPRLQLLGVDKSQRLPIFSMRVRNGAGGFVHHQLFTRMLSDCFGIQARGGCACAGPYAHRLLGIDEETSNAVRAGIAAGREIEKPGWVRLNFSFLMDDAKADFLIRSVDALARDPSAATAYCQDAATARFGPAGSANAA